MGLGFVIGFYLLGSAILFGAALAVCALTQLLVRKRWPWLGPWLNAAPFVIAATPMALLAAGLLWINFAPAGFRFKEVFAVSAGQNIHDLKARGSGVNDAEEIDMAFATDEAGWRKLIGPSFETVEDKDQLRDLVPMAGSELPSWWNGHRCGDRTVRVARHLRNWDEIVVTRCRDDGRVYVQASWVD